MKQPFRAVIVHGSGGSPERNWFPWLRRELEMRGIVTFVPRFPTPKGQSLESWLRVFEAEIGPVSGDLLLFGHSIGAALVLNVLEQSRTPAGATFLVAGFIGAINHPVFDPLNSSFFENDLDWSQIRRNAGRLFIYNGDNDPYVPLEKGAEVANNLGAELTIIHGGGHLNQDSGFTTFPRMLDDLDLFITRV